MRGARVAGQAGLVRVRVEGGQRWRTAGLGGRERFYLLTHSLTYCGAGLGGRAPSSPDPNPNPNPNPKP